MIILLWFGWQVHDSNLKSFVLRNLKSVSLKLICLIGAIESKRNNIQQQ